MYNVKFTLTLICKGMHPALSTAQDDCDWFNKYKQATAFIPPVPYIATLYLDAGLEAGCCCTFHVFHYRLVVTITFLVDRWFVFRCHCDEVTEVPFKLHSF